MKNGKRFCLLLLLCAAVLTLLCAAAAAESTDDGFQITDGVLTKYTGPGGDVTIPDGVTEIGSNAFENCKALTGIVIPDSVTKIGMNAFRGCTGLKEVTVPDGVTSIEDYVFYHCEAMERVSLPKGIVSIGHSSFEYCLKLTDIQLPSGLKSIDHSAFWACRSLVKLMLPQSLETIGNTSFGKCSAMNPLQVPETLKSIGEIGPEAPRFCCETGTDAAYVISKASTYNYFCEDGLMLRYTFDSKGEPDGGLVLNDYVGAKKEVLIPSDVTSINNEDIFKDRTDLVAIRFQGNTPVSTSYFTGCTAVIQCPAGYSNAVYLLQQQASSQLNIATYTGSTLMCYAGSLTKLKLQNDWIYEIAADAFNGSSSDADSLETIILPAYLQHLLDGTFSDLDNLKEIYFGDELNQIGEKCFGERTAGELPKLYCTAGTKTARTLSNAGYTFLTPHVHTIVTQPAVEATYTEPGKTEGSYCSECGEVFTAQEDVPALGEKDFTFTTDDTGATVTGYTGENADVQLPSALGGKPVVAIGANAFNGNETITSVTMPDSVTVIGDYAFAYSSVTSITLSEGLTSLGENVFTDARWLTTIDDRSRNFVQTINGIHYNVAGTEIILCPADVAGDIQLPAGLLAVPEKCFEGLPKITSVTFPDSVKIIGAYAFKKCDNLTGVTLPKGLERLEEGLFLKCISLTNIEIPDKVTVIADNVFSGCNALSSVLLSNNITTIGTGAFAAPTLIRSSATAYARTWAQENGMKWEHDVHTIVTQPAVEATYTEPGKTEGSYCSGCGEVFTAQEDVPALGEKDFTFTTDDTGATVTGYKGESTEVHIPSVLGGKPVTKIAEKAFYSDLRITGMHIPASVAEIEEFSFYQCRALDTITVNAESPYYTVEGNVLYTKDMTTLVRAGNVLEDGDLHVPSTVTYIAAGAFSDNKTLQELWIPASVQFINGTNSCGSFCRNFRRFHIDEGNTQYASPDGALYNRTVTQLFLVPEAIGTYRVPDSVTSIADCAIGGTYYGSTTTLDVTMPEGLAFTGDCMFQWMQGTVTFLNPKIRFGEKCFMSSQDSVIIRGYAGSTAQTYAKTNGIQFEDIEAGLAFQYTTDDTGTTITGYTGQGGTVEIPSMLGGKPVVAIGDNAFNRNETITSVTMPDSVTTIGQRAFYDCKALKQLTLPENLTDIGAYAFSGCTALQNVTLPGKLATIAERAFDYTALTAIHIPASVTMIGQRALSQNYDLLKITVDETNNVYCAEDNVLYNKEKTKLIRAGSGLSGDWSIPFGVKTVEAMAFWNCWTLETLRIPATVQSIGQIDMLGGCCEKLSAIVVDAANPVYSSLDGALCSKDGTVLYYLPENIGTYTVPDSVTRIANGAIQFTSSEQEGLNLTLPESLSVIEDGNFSLIHGVFTFLNPNLKIGSDWFMDCNAEKVVIRGYAGSTAQALAEEKNFAFEDLTISAQFQYTVDDTGATVTGYTGQGGTVEIPSVLGGKPVVAIGNNAFQMPNLEIRTDITAVILPEGLQSIGRSAFWGCAGIASIEIPDSVTEIGWAAFETCENLTSVTLPKNLTQISDSLFHNCPLTEIDLPQGITRIGDYAFRDTGLTAIVIPEGTLSIGKCAFEGCSELSAVTIPASVTEVGECAFANCPKLAPLDEILPEKLTKVIDGVVYNADGTQIIGILPTLSGEVRIADGITVIPQQLFADNTSITSVILPNSIKTIEWRAFSGCTSLAQIEFPEGLLTIGDYAFSSTGLTTVVLPSTLTTFGEGVFDGCTKLANIEDKSGKFLKVVDGIVYNVDGTQILSVLESCTGEVHILEGVTEISEDLFRGRTGITSIYLPDSVTAIDAWAFAYCENLKTVELPAGLERLEDYTFWFCESLEQINLPSSLKSIGGCAFLGNALKEIELPEGLNVIGRRAFERNPLTFIRIPASVTQIEEGAFAGCSALKNLQNDSSVVLLQENGVLYNEDGTVLIGRMADMPAEVVLKEGLLSIPMNFFMAENITSIVIPDSVTSVGYSVFRGCRQLTEVRLSECLTVLESGMFDECTQLGELYVPSAVTSIDPTAIPDTTVIRSEPDAYARTWAQENGYVWQCAQHGEAVIAEPAVPATRKRTGMTAKLQCSVCGAVLAEPEVIPVFDGKVMKLPAALKSVQRETFLNLPAECFVLPDGCLVIGEKAFADCKMLKLVEIPASVVAIADDAFEGCENVLIVTPEGSAAERYAQNHGILVTSDDP